MSGRVWGGGGRAQASITTITLLQRDVSEKFSRTPAPSVSPWPGFGPWPSHLLPTHITLEVSIALGHFIVREMWVIHLAFHVVNGK